MSKGMKEQLEALLNFEDPITKQHWMTWDKGDCSEVGLCEILLAQLIREHKSENGMYYDTDYDQIKLRYKDDFLPMRNISDGYSIESMAPIRNLRDRYSIESMAKSRGLTVEEFKVSIEEEIKIKNDLIQKYLDKGYTQEEAETTALRILRFFL